MTSYKRGKTRKKEKKKKEKKKKEEKKEKRKLMIHTVLRWYSTLGYMYDAHYIRLIFNT